ncbi:MAG: M15 family metallopeptidase [Candidatus Marinimicrobia bacterium]|nr:M15 family metallopeptidase [Candidatus Neomarinimicrobiota bacterium]MCF7850865.1 M15 family metallopeptidase [Candidatus Neomarinimicrobiota bacterium]MCF7904380.1 M15 family metallopeptidase [Candidatus Neomarinimicrobiota bacterium]
MLLLAAPSLGQLGQLERRMLSQGLVNIHSLAPDILVDLKYSSHDNFLNTDTYGELETCYLQPKAANMLRIAQGLLKADNPELTLLVYDGARPRSVQREMWKLVVNTPQQGYVANPDRGSVHNYGCAVDLTIASNDGIPLDMGTPFDFFGDLAQPRYEDRFVASGKLTRLQIANRKLLRDVMIRAGFKTISNEWWHFNAVPVKVARSTYGIVE